MSSAADRNLLFGILALQMDFVGREQLIAAMNGWVLEKSTPLGEILRRQNALGADELELLDALVSKHLSRHGNDPQRSLAAVSSIESLRDQLEQLADPDIRASLAQVSQDGQSEDSQITRTVTLGVSTSAGQRFRVLRPHARGGLGEVFVAEDSELHREVALKQIISKRADDPASRSRFVLEAEITGGLEHPGIVPIYGLGTYADGRPFYAMRFIRGDSLKDAIERFHAAATAPRDAAERSLRLRKLLGRFIDVCNAIEYAHSRGVLHRDLKPANVMLGKYGETLVVDWGLAKAVGRTGQHEDDSEAAFKPSSGSGTAPTQMGKAIGTPQYMSPEQAGGRLDLLGPASDVYSLGATLYCLLTGKSPLFDHATDHISEILRRVQAGEIAAPRRVKPDISKPLDAVCRKAMSIKPSDRYTTPRGLADDIEHWLADEPIAALPDSVSALVSRFSRRHRAWVQAAAASLVLLAVAAAVGIVLINGAKNDAIVAKNDATTAEGKALKLAGDKSNLAKQLTRELFELGAAEIARGDADKGMVILARAFESAAESDPLRDSICRLLGASEVSRSIRLRHAGAVSAVTYCPDGTTVLTGSSDNTARLWDAHTGKPIGEPMKHERTVRAVAYSPDGSTVLTGSSDNTARLWEAHTGKPIGEPMKHERSVSAVAYSPDGATVLTGSGFFNGRGESRLWDAHTGKPIGEPMKHEGIVGAAAYSPDGSTVLTGSWDNTARLWDSHTGKPIGKPMKHDGAVIAVSYSPDSTTVLTGSDDGTARFWDAHTGKPIGEPMKHEGAVGAAAYSPDGSTVLTGGGFFGGRGEARLWDAHTGKPLGEPMKHETDVQAITFSPDSTTVLTGSADGTARRWSVPPSVPKRIVPVVVATSNGLKMSESGVIQALSDAEVAKAWKTLETEGPDWLAERRKFVERRTLGWHRYEAGNAQSNARWFTAAFHLRILRSDDKSDEDVHQRLNHAEKMLAWERTHDNALALQFNKWSYAADEKGLPGSFEKNDSGWVEVKNGMIGARFKETARTPEYVELHDEGRKLWVRLKSEESAFSTDHTAWNKLHKGAPVSDQPEPEQPVSPPPSAATPTRTSAPQK